MRTLTKYPEQRLVALREQKRGASGPVSTATYRLEGAIEATEHALAAARKAEVGLL